MKKTICILLIVIMAIIEIILVYINLKNHVVIAERIGISNWTDFYIENILVSGFGPGSDNRIYITFKIPIDKYNMYNLKYRDANDNWDSIYYGEIANKKVQTSDFMYKCIYEKMTHDKEEKNELSQMMIARLSLKAMTFILSLFIIIYFICIKEKPIRT